MTTYFLASGCVFGEKEARHTWTGWSDLFGTLLQYLMLAYCSIIYSSVERHSKGLRCMYIMPSPNQQSALHRSVFSATASLSSRNTRYVGAYTTAKKAFYPALRTPSIVKFFFARNLSAGPAPLNEHQIVTCPCLACMEHQS